MRVAVRGGAGYIGSVVADVLLADGYDVLIFDNLEKGQEVAIPKTSRFVRVDIRDRKGTAAAGHDFACETVIYMAASSLVGESVGDPGQYFANNLIGGLTLLDAMRDASVLRLFSSTAAVYGEPAKQPIEERDPTIPINPYGESKLAFERTLRWYPPAYGLGRSRDAAREHPRWCKSVRLGRRRFPDSARQRRPPAGDRNCAGRSPAAGGYPHHHTAATERFNGSDEGTGLLSFSHHGALSNPAHVDRVCRRCALLRAVAASTESSTSVSGWPDSCSVVPRLDFASRVDGSTVRRAIGRAGDRSG
jgi:NAD dependent epimerase/dehydratase family